MSTNSNGEDIEFMLEKFKPERYAYLSITIASFIILLICVILFITKNEMNERNVGYVAGMVGSSGAITYTASQLLRMWSDCINYFLNKK
ncbi:hypothetical protein GO755_34840 [Spirosoma sp. HMF4905]|uniref:Uncharacterized protein n=1 Tax=Spirosoma arboris TaxID=2682092 RepID=A0A7K1SN89_9BACT|nr:hypothetical protein [Spirosoma arboris]MVM35251.1 hypothetical protein [Spirosoma arboris]